MKTLAQSLKAKKVTMRDDIEIITMSELRNLPGDVLAQVQLGKTFIITKNGKEIAVLQSLPGDTLPIYVNGKGYHSYLPLHLSKVQEPR